MCEELYEQAKQNVAFEIREKIKERIREEYKKLKFESEKKQADKKTSQKIKSLYKKSKTIFPINWGNAYSTHHRKQEIEEYAKTGIYHPQKLLNLEK